jgi:hypothetical protein
MHRNRAKYLGAGADDSAILYRWMAAPSDPIMGGKTAEGHPVIQGDIIANPSCLTDHHPMSVVNEQPGTDGCGGMNFDTAEQPPDLRRQSAWEIKSMAPQKIGGTMKDQRSHPRIEQRNLQQRPRGRVPLLDGAKGVNNAGHDIPG